MAETNENSTKMLGEDLTQKFDLGRIMDFVRNSISDQYTQFANATERSIANPTGAFRMETYKINFKLDKNLKLSESIKDDTSYIRKRIDKLSKEKKNDDDESLSKLAAKILTYGAVLGTAGSLLIKFLGSRVGRAIGLVTAAIDAEHRYEERRKAGQTPYEAGSAVGAGFAGGVAGAKAGLKVGLKIPLGLLKYPIALVIAAASYAAGRNLSEESVDKVNDYLAKNEPVLKKILDSAGNVGETVSNYLPTGFDPLLAVVAPWIAAGKSMVTPSDPGYLANQEEFINRRRRQAIAAMQNRGLSNNEIRDKLYTTDASGNRERDVPAGTPTIAPGYKTNENRFKGIRTPKTDKISLSVVIYSYNNNPNYLALVIVYPFTEGVGIHPSNLRYCQFLTGPNAGQAQDIPLDELKKPFIEININELDAFVQRYIQALNASRMQKSSYNSRNNDFTGLVQKASYTIDTNEGIPNASGGLDTRESLFPTIYNPYGGLYSPGGSSIGGYSSGGISSPGGSSIGGYSSGGISSPGGGGSAGGLPRRGGGPSTYDASSGGTSTPSVYGHSLSKRPIGGLHGNRGKGIVGGDYAAQAFNFFKSKGWSDEEAAAAAGNLQHESANWKTIREMENGTGLKGWGDLDGKSFGIAQWRGDRYKALIAKYGKRPSFQQQLQFAYDEATKGPNAVGFNGTGRNKHQLSERWRKVFEVSPMGTDSRNRLTDEIYERARKGGGHVIPNSSGHKMTYEEKFPKHERGDGSTPDDSGVIPFPIGGHKGITVADVPHDGKNKDSREFKYYRDDHYHAGLDTEFKGMKRGDPVIAQTDGIIMRADGSDSGGYGNTVDIYYPSLGKVTRNAHLDSFGEYKVGDKVKKGAVIGHVGSSGNAGSFVHDHFEVFSSLDDYKKYGHSASGTAGRENPRAWLEGLGKDGEKRKRPSSYVIGDSIGLGLQMASGMAGKTKEGVPSSWAINKVKDTDNLIVSVGSNDPHNPQLRDNLKKIRDQAKGKVTWILPANPDARKVVQDFANQNHDDVVGFTPGADKIHPSNYNTLTKDVLEKLKEAPQKDEKIAAVPSPHDYSVFAKQRAKQLAQEKTTDGIPFLKDVVPKAKPAPKIPFKAEEVAPPPPEPPVLWEPQAEKDKMNFDPIIERLDKLEQAAKDQGRDFSKSAAKSDALLKNSKPDLPASKKNANKDAAQMPPDVVAPAIHFENI